MKLAEDVNKLIDSILKGDDHTKRDRKRIELKQVGGKGTNYVWHDTDYGEESEVYGSKGTAEQMKRQGTIKWKN
jgi:hypothetical protein